MGFCVVCDLVAHDHELLGVVEGEEEEQRGARSEQQRGGRDTWLKSPMGCDARLLMATKATARKSGTPSDSTSIT